MCRHQANRWHPILLSLFRTMSKKARPHLRGTRNIFSGTRAWPVTRYVYDFIACRGVPGCAAIEQLGLQRRQQAGRKVVELVVHVQTTSNLLDTFFGGSRGIVHTTAVVRRGCSYNDYRTHRPSSSPATAAIPVLVPGLEQEQSVGVSPIPSVRHSCRSKAGVVSRRNHPGPPARRRAKARCGLKPHPKHRPTRLSFGAQSFCAARSTTRTAKV